MAKLLAKLFLFFAKLILIGFIFNTQMCFAESSAEYSAIQLNSQGVAQLKKENYLAAQESFIQALSKVPFWGEVHYNLGLSFYGLTQIDKAMQSFTTALQLTQKDQVKFYCLFNMAEISGKEKKIDQALSYYQQALQLKPDSVEVKTNIELLIQDQQKNQSGGEGQDDNDKKDEKDDKDQKGNDQKDNKDDNKDKKDDDKQDEKKEGDKEDKPKQYGKNKPQPKPFKSEELTQGDVNKILGELKQQEQKIRAEFNKKAGKDKPRDKDW